MSGTSGSGSAESAAAVFAEYRSLLFTVAYEITGSVADAEDVVQDSFLRWTGVDQSQVRSPRAYLAKIATREALNKLRSASRRREEYVGSWLPEPVLTEPDVADDLVLAESVSMAMMVVLETLTPDERAVFVLGEVFGFSHAEIAEAIGKKVPAVRQIASRARSHVQARRPAPAAAVDHREADSQLVDRFMLAATTGNLQALMDVLAPDVVLLTDAGGQKSAALRPINGADKVGRFLVAVITEKIAGTLRAEPALVNSAPGSVVYIDDVADTIGTFDLVDGRISTIYLVRNPNKLAGHGTRRRLGR
ncbi:RNA polymerase sigma-70 factor [Nakamurella lactea]|uniref:RNA polymerase sigma-70 factor n=1 Tax=Nakamurella lactea TaxID=459515 RepID=UPI00041C590A|nr:RNA polymerase sigma-70 factor [Nakamurella lactea]